MNWLYSIYDILSTGVIYTGSHNTIFGCAVCNAYDTKEGRNYVRLSQDGIYNILQWKSLCQNDYEDSTRPNNDN